MESKLQKLNYKVSTYNELIDDLKELKKDEKVKEYIEKNDKIIDLASEIETLKIQIMKLEMQNCNHLFVKTGISHSFTGNRTDFLCLKCGLTTEGCCYGREIEEIMDELLYNKRYNIKTDITCDFSLAKGIVSGIKKAHPDLTDEQLEIYFKRALKSIRNNEVTEEVKNKRIKRLSLKKDFNKWNESDVHSRF